MPLSSRRAVIAGAAACLLPGTAWPFVEPHRLAVRRYEIVSHRWPRGCPPLKIAFLTDPHVGCASVDPDRLAAIVAQTNRLGADLVLLGGDYVQHEEDGRLLADPREVSELLSRLRAPLGVFAVLGNHDWWIGGRRVLRALETAGIATLENATTVIEGPCRFALAGFADDRTRRADVAGTLAQVDAKMPVVALAHDPATFLDMPPRPVVTLCGHTHGGQVRLPWIGALHIPTRAPMRWAYGHIVEPQGDLVVSGGIGTSGPPIRLNVPPEVVLLTLNPGTQADALPRGT